MPAHSHRVPEDHSNIKSKTSRSFRTWRIRRAATVNRNFVRLTKRVLEAKFHLHFVEVVNSFGNDI